MSETKPSGIGSDGPDPAEPAPSWLEAARPHWHRAQAHLTDALGPERWAGFLADLRTTVAAVRAP